MIGGFLWRLFSISTLRIKNALMREGYYRNIRGIYKMGQQ